MILDACTTMCSALSTTFGPVVTEILAFVVTGALLWWQGRKAIKRVEVKADAGIAIANESASKAKAEARAAHVQLAELKGSLHPPATILIDTSKPRASMADPSLSGEDPLPNAGTLPTIYYRQQTPVPPQDAEDTARETPSSKEAP